MSRRHDNCDTGFSEFRAELIGADVVAQYPELPDALARLEAALAGLPDPLSSVTADITPDDVGMLMRPMQVSVRTSMLKHLRFPNPRLSKVPPALCREIAARLRTSREHDRWHAVRTLTTPIRAALTTATALWSSGVQPDDIARLDDWPDRLLRAALWSTIYASRDGARYLVWANTTQWWLPDSCSPEHSRDLLDAAQAVIDASPGYHMEAPGDAFGARTDDVRETVRRAERSAHSDITDIQDANGAKIRPTPQSTDETETPVGLLPLAYSAADSAKGDGRGPDQWPARWQEPATDAAAVLAWAGPARESAGDVQRRASAAAQLIEADVRAGRLPDPRAVSDVVEYESYLSVLFAQVGGVDDLDGFDTLISDLHAASAETPLTRLARLSAHPSAQPEVHSAITRVRDLVEGSVDDALADPLTALSELVEYVNAHGSTADAMKLVELQQRSFALPPDIIQLVGAASVGQLDFTESATPLDKPESDPEEQVADEDFVDGTAELARATAYISPDDDDIPDVSVIANDIDDTVTTGRADETATTAGESAGDTAPFSNVPSDLPDERLAPGPPSAVRTLGTVPEAELSTAAVEAALAHLVAGQHLGLAAMLTDVAAPPSADLAAALRIAALAGQVRTEASPATTRIRALLNDADDLGSSEPTLLLAAAALVRIALVTGDHTCGALLATLSARLDDHLGALASETGRVTLTGALAAGALRTTVTDLSKYDAEVIAAQQAAEELMRRRKLRFKRAGDIANEWLDPDGRLGALLIVAVRDDRAQAPRVATEVAALANRMAVTKLIEAADAKYRGHSGRPLEGQARQDLVHLVDNVLAVASLWVEAVTTRERVTTSDPWAATELAGLRDSFTSHADAALAELDARTGSARSLTAAAAQVARALLGDAVAILSGDAIATADVPVDALLTGDLLKVPRAVQDPATRIVSLENALDPSELVDAAYLSWPDAFEAKIAAEDFTAAAAIVDGCASGMLPVAVDLGPDVRARLDRSRELSVHELTELRGAVEAELRRARMNSVLSAEEDGRLADLLATADPADASMNLGAVRNRLAEIEKLLPGYRDSAAQRLTGRLAALGSDTGHRDRVTALIADGELATAEELIIAAEAGEDLPERSVREDFAAFWPVVSTGLLGGVTRSVVDIVAAGGGVSGCPILGYGDLSADARASTADALRGWLHASTTPVSGRSSLSEQDYLPPVLRLAGYVFGSPVSVRLTSRDRDKRVVEFGNVTFNGKAMLPPFGSGLRGRLRVLVCWGQPAPELLMSWIANDPEKDAVLVAHFGTMTATARRDLAVRVLSLEVPVAVLDDAAVAYLAAHGSQQLYSTMACLGPFTAVQPYAQEKRSTVPPEMFYGRDEERHDVMRMRGPQIVYGGRGLGKSALLRDAQATFMRRQGRVATYTDLKSTMIGPERDKPSEIWRVLYRDLREADVVPRPRTRAAQAAARNISYDDVRNAVREWLVADSRRELLILLDESDQFFEADAPHFAETNKLKELAALAGAEDRAKVVFAGLHSVQRFSNVPNQTFKHLAQSPIVIGPLAPQYAYNLLTRPLQTLGYMFERDDVAFRVLGYCSYQPFLLQMFAHRLLMAMHDKRRSPLAVDEPPYAITLDDVIAVEENPTLKRGITETFADTLNLDPRYFVIANVLALHAEQYGLDVRIGDRDLREECRSWWQPGFENLELEGFRTYLHEMVGLGVLASNAEDRGWRLRSTNTLRMIGTRAQVEENLLSADERQVAPEFAALTTRRTLPSGQTSPLSAQQMVALLGSHTNQTRVVLGSAATGVDLVYPAVQQACASAADGYTLVPVTDRRQFRTALTDGQPGSRRVVLADLHDGRMKVEAAEAGLASAMEMLPTVPGVTRAVVLVAGPGQLTVWQEALTRGVGVPLTRFDAPTLRVWTLEEGRPFSSDSIRDRLLEVTGGWPSLIDEAAALVPTVGEEPAVQKIADRLASPAGAAEFLDTTGVTEDPVLVASLSAIVEWTDGDPYPLADLVEMVSEADGVTDAAGLVACLQALGMFDMRPDGKLCVAPVLVRAWPHRKVAAVG